MLCRLSCDAFGVSEVFIIFDGAANTFEVDDKVQNMLHTPHS